jgi:hypothetical protein
VCQFVDKFTKDNLLTVLEREITVVGVKCGWMDFEAHNRRPTELPIKTFNRSAVEGLDHDQGRSAWCWNLNVIALPIEPSKKLGASHWINNLQPNGFAHTSCQGSFTRSVSRNTIKLRHPTKRQALHCKSEKHFDDSWMHLLWNRCWTSLKFAKAA